MDFKNNQEGERFHSPKASFSRNPARSHHRLSPSQGWLRLPPCQSIAPRACASTAQSPAPAIAPRLSQAVKSGRSLSFTGPPTMTITYSCIANGRAVLAELALTGGSYQEAAATVLKLVLLRAEPKTIMQMGSFVYHTLFIDGITYLCATDNALDTITPSAFLKNVSDTFLRNPLMSQEHFSPSNAVAADFQQVLGKYMISGRKHRSQKHFVMPETRKLSKFTVLMAKDFRSQLKEANTGQ
ncbi:uncharacterized protein LOC116630271 [Phoca vitulina]|uniref:uncharacterized protein LOC116630271 n=1 Tax=Phoca vitulina TaxID=9720 RepID=UPI00139615D1|nr:uncharacterized protein LOC116630271 [Phoca vitulina]